MLVENEYFYICSSGYNYCFSASCASDFGDIAIVFEHRLSDQRYFCFLACRS